MPKRNYTRYCKYITDDEIGELKEFVLKYSPSVRLAFYIMLELGLRCSEAISVNIKDIDFSNKVLTVHATKQSITIQRAIPDTLLKRLEVHYKQHKEIITKKNGFLCFVNGHGSLNDHLKYSTMAYFFRDFRHAKGYNDPYFIDKTNRPLYRFATHTLRAYAISKFIKKASETHGSNSIVLAQNTWGHQDVKTTLGYVRIPNSLEISRDILNSYN